MLGYILGLGGILSLVDISIWYNTVNIDIQ